MTVKAGGHHEALGGLAEGDVTDGVEVTHGWGLVEADQGGAVLSAVLPVPGGQRLLCLDLLGHLAALQQLCPATDLGACHLLFRVCGRLCLLQKIPKVKVKHWAKLQ